MSEPFGNPTPFQAQLDRMAALHARKNRDYAAPGDPFSNFTYAADVIAPFVKNGAPSIAIVFATMLGIKLARIGELSGGRAPLNESLLDSIDDLATYASIWAAMAHSAAPAATSGSPTPATAPIRESPPAAATRGTPPEESEFYRARLGRG